MGLFIINRRRKYFIDRKFQIKFIVKFCLITVLASVLIGALAYYFNLQTTTISFENMKVVVKSTSEFIMPVLFFILVIVTILAALTVILVALFTSHKIIGPLHRFSSGLERMKQGDLTRPFNIRENDQLQVVSTDLEDTRVMLNGAFRVIADGWNILKEKKYFSSKKTAELKRIIEEIDKELEKFKYS